MEMGAGLDLIHACPLCSPHRSKLWSKSLPLFGPVNHKLKLKQRSAVWSRQTSTRALPCHTKSEATAPILPKRSETKLLQHNALRLWLTLAPTIISTRRRAHRRPSARWPLQIMRYATFKMLHYCGVDQMCLRPLLLAVVIK